MSLQATLPQIITAVGGLGTAAFGLVDATKPLFGVNYIGFGGVRSTVTALTPPNPAGAAVSALSQKNTLATIEANWINGTDLASQKAIAKSLIKLNFSPANAAALGAATGADPATLEAYATSAANGTKPTSAETDVYARFDFMVTALLDEAYQRADQVYRNWTRLLATVMAVMLAVVGSIVLDGWAVWIGSRRDIVMSIVVGLLATPLAPIAKDLSTALATAVNTMQLVKK
jgi:hypothetical protein